MKRARSCSSRVEVRNGSRCGVLSGRRCGRRVEVRNGSRGSAWGLLVGLGGCRISMTSYYMFFFNRALASTRSSLPLRVASFPLSHRAGIPEIYRPLTVHVRSARPPHPGVHNASQSSCTPTGYEGTRSCTPTVAPRDARRKPRARTCLRSTGSRSRASPSTLRAVRSSPLPRRCRRCNALKHPSSKARFVKLLKPKPRRRHRVAHPTAHRWEPCEVCGIVEILRSKNVSGDEVVGEAGDGLARVRIAAALALFLSRASFFTGHRVGTQTWMVSGARRCVEASERAYCLD